ncbi:presenilin family intramembrane aspartyl protease PSH [Halorhabdus amylolytica]|uniref:presenilin family intramembrane aspartyl protease PSH n=1 Tax=Halorhabdus amylolytica TaxID=2559573 RepID=UPI0010A9C020|nr:presenilin family intramembrane aspartyl protease PSH [Halorhabdus amylolytica]
MDRNPGLWLAVSVIVAIFLAVQLGALALVEPLKSAGLQPVEDPQDPTNSLLYILAILVMTGVMLAAFRYNADWSIRGLIVLTGVYIAWIVFSMLLPPVVTLPVGGGVHGLAVAGAIALGIGLLVYPEWYVIDVTGAIMGAGAAGLFGITFGVFPALVLLSILAVYDAISVYGTEHMLSLASGVMDLNVPVVLVAPTTLGYSFIDDDGPMDGEPSDEDDSADDGLSTANDPADDEMATGVDGSHGADEEGDPIEERDALFIGLGDAVVPTVLVASAAFFAPASIPTIGVGGFSTALPAVTAMIGTFVGLAILLWMVLKGRAHAGLPLLNSGVIAGYLVGALASGLSIVEALGLAPYL